MSSCTSGVGWQVLPFIDNSHLGSILFSCYTPANNVLGGYIETWVKVFRFHTEFRNFPRGRFIKSCKYQLQVSNFILKLAWPSLILQQIYDTYTGDCRFIMISVIHTSRTISKSRFFPQF